MPTEQPTLDVLRGSGTTLMAKMALAKLSEDLVASPSARAAFTKDPTAFIRNRFGFDPTAGEQSYFAALARFYENGNCCTGCGCGGTTTFVSGER